MKKNYVARMLAACLAVSMALTPLTSIAHSGRTDSRGGHKDNKNASGLGSYHYHHGESAHLHPGGVCPYDTVKSGSSTVTTTQAKSSASKVTVKQKTKLYQEADVDSKVLASVAKGTTATIKEETTYFYKVTIDGKTGYLRKKHVTAK